MLFMCSICSKSSKGFMYSLCFVWSMCTMCSTSQVLMMNMLSLPRRFMELSLEDKELTTFTMTNLVLRKDANGNMVYMALKLKRKVATELLTTYLPTILLLLITYTTVFFDKDLFGDAIAVNLTIMLVMTTIFTSKIEELPPTSDTKMIDIWLIFCLLVPFAFTLIRTAIECYREDETDAKRPEAWSSGPVEDGLVVCLHQMTI